MVEKERFIGFDVGAESGRCIVGTINNEKLMLEETHRFLTPMIECRDHIFWDILRMYQEIEQGLCHTAEQFGSDLKV